MNRHLYIFGTGHAMVTRLYNSCFGLEENGAFFFLDAGGGNGILQAMEAMKVPYSAPRHLFITHTHTDHILGGVWLMRAVGSSIRRGKHEGGFTVWGNRAVIDAFRQICLAVLAPNIGALLDRQIRLRAVEDGERASTSFGDVTFFDTGSTTVSQFGCTICLPDGKRLAYLGDEPVHPQARPYIQGCDYLVAEAMCLYAEREKFHPERAFHSNVKDTCQQAEALGVKHLVLCHTEDTHGPERKALYTAEGRQYFHGALFVPDDREVLPLA